MYVSNNLFLFRTHPLPPPSASSSTHAPPRPSQIAIEDPVAMVHARNIAIASIVFEVLGFITAYCFSDRCIAIVILAVASSSAVACCFTQRAVYAAWSVLALLLVCLHLLTAADGFSRAGFEFDQIFKGMVHLFLGGVCVVVACIGCQAAATVGNRALLEHRHTGVPVQGANCMGQGMQPYQVDSHA